MPLDKQASPNEHQAPSISKAALVELPVASDRHRSNPFLSGSFKGPGATVRSARTGFHAPTRHGTAQHSTVSNVSGCCALRPVCSGVSPPLSLADLTHRRALILHQRFDDVGETEGREEVGFGAIGLVGHQTNGPASEEDKMELKLSYCAERI